jgi:hypothetical protein
MESIEQGLNATALGSIYRESSSAHESASVLVLGRADHQDIEIAILNGKRLQERAYFVLVSRLESCHHRLEIRMTTLVGDGKFPIENNPGGSSRPCRWTELNGSRLTRAFL